MLTEVRLYGHLAKKFGKVHHFALRTPAQAINALSVNLPGFRQYMTQNSEPGYYVILGKNKGLTEEELVVPREMPVLKIVPGVQGRKAAGGLQMVLGAVLIVIGVIIGYAYGWTGAGWVVGQGFIKIGAGMLIGGIAAYLSQPPDMNQNDMKAGLKKSSYAFDGPENTIAQGGPVPVVYGMLGVGSTLGAAAIYAEEVQIGSTVDDDDKVTGAFHIYRPRLETIRTVDPNYPSYDISDSIMVWAGDPPDAAIAPYTFTVEESADLALGDNGHSLKANASLYPSGHLPIGNYSCMITCTDSTPGTPKVCTKEISYVVRTSNINPGAASIHLGSN